MTVLSGIKQRASSSSSWSNLLDITFPTNSIYITYTNNSPANFLGGTWARIGDNRMLIGAGSSYTSGSTGGSANAIVVSHSHTASSASAGSHSHTITVASNGSSGTNANLPPYLGVYFWRRTA